LFEEFECGVDSIGAGIPVFGFLIRPMSAAGCS
jgi:hypothetical protein